MTFKQKMEQRRKAREARRPLEGMDMYLGDEDELEDLDLDDILEVDEDEVEFVDECPPGCKPADEEGEEEMDEELEEKLEGEEEMEASTKKTAKKYTIESSGGDILGTWEADSPEEALDLLAQDAGYANHKDAGDSSWTESEAVFSNGDVDLLVTSGKCKPAAKKNNYYTRLVSEADLANVDPKDIDIMLFGEQSQDPHYVLFAAGVPLAEIRRSDQNLDEDNQGLFTDDIFPQGVMDMVDRLGAVETLGTLKVRYYANQTSEDQQYQKAAAAVKADSDTAYAQRVAELKTELLSKMSMAFEASRKNFILDNSLKDALVENIKTANVPERIAIDMVEDAFQTAGAHYFAELLKTAEEWMGYEPEAYAQIKTNIQKMTTLDPSAVAARLEADEPVEEAPAYQPAKTAAAQTPQDEPSYEADEAAVRAHLRRAHLNFSR